MRSQREGTQLSERSTGSESCPFCLTIGDREALSTLGAYDEEGVLAIPSLLQRARNPGHTLVIPRLHVPTIYDLPGTLAGPLMMALSLVARALKASTKAEGITIRQNNDRAGGQDVYHLHFHLVPRWLGDKYTSYDVPFQEVGLVERTIQAQSLRAALATQIGEDA